MAHQATPPHPLVPLQDPRRLSGRHERAGRRVRRQDQGAGGQGRGGPDPEGGAVHARHHLRDGDGDQGGGAGRRGPLLPAGSREV